MTTGLPPNLERIGDQLDRAWRPAPRRHPRRLVAIASGLAVAVAVVLALTLDLGGASRPGDDLPGVASAQAAIARARAALTPPAHGVFHVRIELRQPGTAVRVNEIWQSSTSLRATNTGMPESGTLENGTQLLYDAARNTIYQARTSRAAPSSLITEYTAEARALLRSGARVAGHATVDGIDCIRIEDTRVRGVTDTLFVDARTYRPVLQRTGGPTPSELRFRDWQVLAPTTASLRLANVRLLHPHARVVSGTKQLYAAQVRLEHLLPGPPGQPPRPRPPASFIRGLPTKEECVAAFNAPANAAWRRVASRLHVDRAVVANALLATPGCSVKLWLPRDRGPWQHAVYVYGRWLHGSARFVGSIRIGAVTQQHEARIRTPIRWANAVVRADGRLDGLTSSPGGLPSSR